MVYLLYVKNSRLYTLYFADEFSGKYIRLKCQKYMRQDNKADGLRERLSRAMAKHRRQGIPVSTVF